MIPPKASMVLMLRNLSEIQKLKGMFLAGVSQHGVEGLDEGRGCGKLS